MQGMRKALLGTVMALGLAATAQAGPITIDPGSLSANGQVQAVFAFVDAADTSILLELSIGNTIFNNQTDAVGTTRAVGTFAGSLAFVLQNLSQGYSFTTGVLDSVDGAYHAFYSTNFADFGVGALSGAAASAIAGLPGTPLYVGFEDRRGGDYDYNDLIFAFSAVSVPEPASMALFGTGLLGLGLARRRRRAN